MTKIKIKTASVEVSVRLCDTPTAKQILNALPLEGQANIWGSEAYFVTPLHILPEPDAREEVEVGELGFWPVGSAFCLFYGRTPVSTSDKPKAYSPVNVFGKVEGDITPLHEIKEGETIKVVRDDEE